MQKQYYSIKSLDEFEFSEIDFDLYENLFGKNYDSDKKEHPNQIGQYYREGYPILIDRLIDKLNEFKEKGANYVSLEYHNDHIGYPMEALLIKKMSNKDIDEYEKNVLKKEEEKNKKILEKNKKILELQNQINLIKKS